MRMINDVNEILEVYEVVNLAATPCGRSDWSEDGVPDWFMLTVQYAEQEDDTEFGEYKMDGTMETYKKAIADFNRICLKAAKEGYFCLSDFQNCEIY